MDDQVPVTVSVGWALWSKHPGSSRDYAVLSSSREPFTSSEFASVLAHFAPGTPPTESGLPGSLPWVTISRVSINQQRYVGIAIQKATDRVDGAGRPIARTLYFCIPYAQLAETPVSYSSLYEKLDGINLPHEDDDLVRLSVPRLSPEALAADIREHGERAVAAAAALLLSGSVNIIGSEGSTIEERLHYLDAVAAMLPNGYRTDFTAATWSDSAARHHIRLAFAARARDDAGVVRWRSEPARITGGDPAETYLSLVCQVLDRVPDQGRLAQLINYFATSDATPRTFEQPQFAIASVRDFDLPFIVWNAVRNGTANPEDVRAVFNRSRISELPSEGRQALLECLIDSGDTSDWPIADKWWDVVVGDSPGVMLPALARTSRRLLWTPAPSLALREPLNLAANHGLLDHLLAELIVVPVPRSGMNSALSAAAQALADWVLASPAGFPATQRAVAGNPLVACELLAQQADSEQGARAAVAFLEPVMRGFLHPFFVVLGFARGIVDQSEVGQLSRSDVDCVRALLQAASYGGRLQLVLPGFTAWLAGSARGPSDAAVRRYWRDILWALNPDDAISRAWLDLALLITGDPPRYLLADLNRQDREVYNEYLARAWTDLAARYGRALDDLLTDTLSSSLARMPSATDKSHADFVVDLVVRLTEGGKRDRLAAVTASSLSAVPERSRSEYAQGWLAQVQRSRPDAVQDGTLSALRHAPPDVTAAQLARLCAQAFSNNTDMREACQALAESGAITTGASATAVLEKLRQELLTAPAGKQNSHAWLQWFTARFADGTFGKRTAEDFRRLAVQAAGNEIRYRLDVLFIAATGGQKNSPPELSDAEISQLDWIPKSVDKMIRDAKRAGKPHLFRGAKQGRDEEGEQHDKDASDPSVGRRHGDNQDRAG